MIPEIHVRRGRLSVEAPSVEQEGVDLRCELLRLQCEGLLEKFGERRVDISERLITIVAFLQPPLWLVCYVKKINPFELSTRLLIRKENCGRMVSIESSNGVPSKSDSIKISIEGSDEYLKLERRSGGVYQSTRRGRLGPKFVRRVNMDDVRIYTEVVSSIEKQP